MQARSKGARHANRRLAQAAGSPVTGYLHPTACRELACGARVTSRRRAASRFGGSAHPGPSVDLTQTTGLDVVDESTHARLVGYERASLYATDRLLDVRLGIVEGLQGEMGSDPNLLFYGCGARKCIRARNAVHRQP